MPRGDFWVNSLLVIVTSVLAFVCLFAAGETVLRARYGALAVGAPTAMKAHDELRGWKLQPGRYTYFDVRAVRRVDISINEHGLRNAPLAPAAAPGVERITLLGDSFVFGAPLEEDETIAGRLRAMGGEGFEFVNAGVPGYGTGQQYRLLEELQEKGLQLGRKLVLFFFTNDIQDNLGLQYATLARYLAQPAFGIDAHGRLHQTVTRPLRPRRRHGDGGWVGELLFFHVLRYQLEVLAVSHPQILRVLEALGFAPELPRTPGIVAGWYGAQWEERWRVTEALVEYVVTALRTTADGPEVLVAFVPSPFQVQEFFRRTLASGADSDARLANFLSDPDRPQRLLQSLAQRLEVPFIDLTPALRSAAEHVAVYFPREGHFNEAGCEIVARAIYDRLMNQSAVRINAAASPAASPVTSSR